MAIRSHCLLRKRAHGGCIRGRSPLLPLVKPSGIATTSLPGTSPIRPGGLHWPPSLPGNIHDPCRLSLTRAACYITSDALLADLGLMAQVPSPFRLSPLHRRVRTSAHGGVGELAREAPPSPNRPGTSRVCPWPAGASELACELSRQATYFSSVIFCISMSLPSDSIR